MGDDSSRSIVNSLKNEWSFLWEALQSDKKVSGVIEEDFGDGTLEVLTLDKIREITKILVDDRKRFNQRLESISKEIELNTAKLESLQLVGANDDDVVKRIHELHDLGVQMAETLSKLDKKLRHIRDQEDVLQEELISS